MTAFAGDIDFIISGGVRTRPRVVILANICRVAIRAHEIPGLIDGGPVAGIPIGDFLARIKKEPAPAPALWWAAVPRNPKRLQASALHLDKVLLQRVDAECVLDFVVMKGPVGSIGAYHKFRGAAKEGRSDPIVAETCVVEIAQDGGIRGRLHRQLMMRAAPQRILSPVTFSAISGPHELRVSHRGAV